MQIQNPMMFVRSIKGAPASILWVLLLVRQALTVRQICSYTDYKPDSVREALDVLTSYELVREIKRAHGEAFYSLGAGYQFLLPGIDPVAMGKILQMADVDAEPESEKIGFCDAQETAIEMDGEFQSPKKSDSGEDDGQKTLENGKKRVQNPKKSDSEPEKTGSIMIDDDDVLINKPINHQSEPGEEKFPADLKTVLGNLHLVFDDILSVDEVHHGTKPEVAFAWICKINADIRRGGKIRNPIGLLRARLATGSKRKILHQNLLPDAYLRALGFAVEEKLSPFSGDVLDRALEAAREDQAAAEAEKREIEERLNHAVPGEVLATWQNILVALRQELPRSTFETWVESARPVEWKSEILVIAGRNSYAAEFLKGKLAGRINELLHEYLPGATTEFMEISRFLELEVEHA